MPWECQSCKIAVEDDSTCPECKQGKSAWTVVKDLTRNFVVARTKLALLRAEGSETRAAGAPIEISLSEASSAPAIPTALAREIAARGHVPAPDQLLFVEVVPRKKKDWSITISVDYAQEDVVERVFPQDGVALDSSGSFVAKFLLVFGPDSEGLSFPEIEVLDVSEESASGHAPEIEVDAVGKGPLELLVVASEAPAAGTELLEVEDISFRTGAEVFLPDGWQDADAITGLTVVSAALHYAQQHPSKQLLIAGHTDAVGSEASNLVLAGDRAKNVHLYVSGQRAAWAAHCVEHQEVEDCQQVLKWIARTQGWWCDPGPVDGAWGKGSQGALDAFRRDYNEAHGAALAEGGACALADWEAFFDLYDAELADKLKINASELASLRGALSFTAPATLSCGEAWPTQRAGAEGDAANRRVDVLFFSEADLPDLSAQPAGQGIYAEGALTLRYLSVDEAMRDPKPPPSEASNMADSGVPFLKDCPLPHLQSA